MAFSDDAPVHLLKKKASASRQKSSAGWRTVGKQKCYFRSAWEANFARYLEWMRVNKQIKSWRHEPKTFWFLKIKRGVRSYKPDFKVVFMGGLIGWFEVKGWMDKRSATKLKRMAKYYPDAVIKVIGTKWFSANSQIFSSLCPEWESP